MAQHDLTDLIARIEAIGGTVEQLLALDNVGSNSGADLHNLNGWDSKEYGYPIYAWNRKAEAAAYQYVEALELKAAGPVQQTAPLATERQVSYALSLINRRQRSGVEGGWLSFTSTPNAEQLAQMTRKDISKLIDSLRDSYNY